MRHSRYKYSSRPDYAKKFLEGKVYQQTVVFFRDYEDASGRTRIQAERVPSFSGERWRKFCRGLQAERGEKMALVLVVGSTGQLGRAIVWRLRRDGVAGRAMVRPTYEGAMLAGSEAELIVGDLRDPESLRTACRGCDAVVTTATSLRSGFDLERIDRAGNLNLLEAARL